MNSKTRKYHPAKKHFLIASDFDKTLSFNDSGYVLAELLGVNDFEAKVAEVSALNMVQQGGELAYLIMHDPQFRAMRKEHLVEAGKRINLKDNIKLLSKVLEHGIDDYRFSFFVISAAPEEIVQSALKDVLPVDHIFGTRFRYDAKSGEVKGIIQVPAGYGKVAVLNHLHTKLQVSEERVIYSGDGSSDIHVMLHINQRKGYTIAVSQAQYVTQIAKRTVLSDNAVSVLVPVLEDIVGWDATRIRTYFESHELLIQEWAKMRTDILTIRSSNPPAEPQS